MMRVEMLESRIEVQARLKPDSTAPRMARPLRSFSRVRSKMRMLASTATPDGEDEAGQPGQGERDGNELEDGEDHGGVDHQGQRGHEAGRAVEGDHEDQHEERADHAGPKAGFQGFPTERVGGR